MKVLLFILLITTGSSKLSFETKDDANKYLETISTKLSQTQEQLNDLETNPGESYYIERQVEIQSFITESEIDKDQLTSKITEAKLQENQLGLDADISKSMFKWANEQFKRAVGYYYSYGLNFVKDKSTVEVLKDYGKEYSPNVSDAEKLNADLLKQLLAFINEYKVFEDNQNERSNLITEIEIEQEAVDKNRVALENAKKKDPIDENDVNRKKDALESSEQKLYELKSSLSKLNEEIINLDNTAYQAIDEKLGAIRKNLASSVNSSFATFFTNILNTEWTAFTETNFFYEISIKDNQNAKDILLERERLLSVAFFEWEQFDKINKRRTTSNQQHTEKNLENARRVMEEAKKEKQETLEKYEKSESTMEVKRIAYNHALVKLSDSLSNWTEKSNAGENYKTQAQRLANEFVKDLNSCNKTEESMYAQAVIMGLDSHKRLLLEKLEKSYEILAEELEISILDLGSEVTKIKQEKEMFEQKLNEIKQEIDKIKGEITEVEEIIKNWPVDPEEKNKPVEPDRNGNWWVWIWWIVSVVVVFFLIYLIIYLRRNCRRSERNSFHKQVDMVEI